MIRTAILFSVLIGFGSGLFSQSLSLKFGDEIVSNDSIYYTGTTSDDLLELHLKVENLSDKDIEVKVRKTEVSLIENSINYFCWGSCFMPHIYTSPSSVSIMAYSTDLNSFSGDYQSSGLEGTSIINYTFFNAQNEQDSVMVTVFYQVGADGIRDLLFNEDQVRIYPNPVDRQLNIEFNSVPDRPYTIRLLGLNGQVLYELVRESRNPSHSFRLEKLSSSFAIVEITSFEGQSIFRKVLVRN